MAEHSTEILQRHSASYEEVVPDSECELSSHELSLPYFGEPKQVIRLQHAPKRTVLLRNQSERYLWRKRVEHVWAELIHARAHRLRSYAPVIVGLSTYSAVFPKPSDAHCSGSCSML